MVSRKQYGQMVRMGSFSGSQRDEEVYRLGWAIKDCKVRTMTAAMRYTGSSRTTVMSYLRELDMSIIDDQLKTVTKTKTGSVFYGLDS